MEVNLKQIEYDGTRNHWFHVVPMGDVHLGNICCDLKKFKEMVEWIRSKDDVLWIGMGDYVDCINYTDKRFDQATVARPYCENLSNAVPLQIQDFIELIEPIADKCIGMHRGNHEETIRLKYHYDVMYKVWEAYGIPMLNDSALTRLRFVSPHEKGNSHVFDIYSTHGRAGGRKGGNKINWLEDMITYVDADVYLMAHSHIKETETKTSLYVDNRGNLKTKKRILAVTGCFLNGYQQGVTSYAEKWGYPPTDTGVVKLAFNPRKHDVHISE